MRVALFCHSLLSDWNHGNAHFLRGIVSELARRGHGVRAFEPRAAWSVENLMADHGPAALAEVERVYPHVRPVRYEGDLDLDEALDGVDVVLVHEWNEPALVRRIAEHRARRGSHYVALFHDTHHRAVTAPADLEAFGTAAFDGVLAFGRVLRDVYLARGWARRAWVWHEAADTHVFKPQAAEREGDLVWVGNWGDEERTAELHEFLLGPVHTLGLRAHVRGVRYPTHALAALGEAGIAYGSWIGNFRVPALFAAHRVTVHVPRRAYVEALPGIPTIRPFEAMACGIPLVSAPWEDAEHLFTPGEDFLVARDGAEMTGHLRALLAEPARAQALAEHGRRTILARHTCVHRVDELLDILHELGVRTGPDHDFSHREATPCDDRP